MSAPHPTSAHAPAYHPRRTLGFSLVEVVLALGIFVFVVVALVGLVSVGIETNRQSFAVTEASNLAQSFLAIRRSAPLAPEIGLCPLPPLDGEATVPLEAPHYLKTDGTLTSSPEQARFALSYRISPPDASRKFSTVYICLFWPPRAQAANAAGFHETTASFLIP